MQHMCHVSIKSQLDFLEGCHVSNAWTANSSNTGTPRQIEGTLLERGAPHQQASCNTVQRFDPVYQATKLHFEDLERRYGNPIIILNLIKTFEKRPREMILRREYCNAVGYLNQNLPAERHLTYIHWDFHKYTKSKSQNVLEGLGALAHQALEATGFFYSGRPPNRKQEMRRAPNSNDSLGGLSPVRDFGKGLSPVRDFGKGLSPVRDFGRGPSPARDFGKLFSPARDFGKGFSPAHDFGKGQIPPREFSRSPILSRERENGGWESNGRVHIREQQPVSQPKSQPTTQPKSQPGAQPKSQPGDHERPVELTLQSGVLRTNCIDCLDRTNVAQYAFGLCALGRQLHALGLTDVPKLDPDGGVATTLMDMYQNMGDALALQYGGSAAHNTVFPERQGKWKAATQSKELLKSIRRYYSNTYTDAEKQDAINLFLGHFRPQKGRAALWELDNDYYLHVGTGDSSEESPSDELRAIHNDGFSSAVLVRNPASVTGVEDRQRLKLTSFEKLTATSCGAIKSVRMYGDTEGHMVREGGSVAYSSGPEVANLMLYWDEAQFIDDLRQ
ncbi:hypothetical protein CBR_g54842 [Chara braunii]|uniref:SAC domain-containing protein n=1 Tax=Chara braunii TaxID=69332 RepID=A0A388JPJ5_CHABU|nr:hypothetical protein CBR_g54842 [Chara braunii]|eukprot:GBG59739.1 hypothetical protein CBR_g54842 [Chara braunii]